MWYRNIPDRLVLLPGGRVAFIELKRPGEKARVGQERMGQTLLDLGMSWAVLDTKEKVDEFLDRH
jgi:hypothetical protein